MRTNGRTDRHTDMINIIVDVRNFGDAPEYSTFSADCGLIVKVRFRTLILRRIMSYIYMEHPFLMFLDHTQRRSTVGRTSLDE